MRSLRPRSQSTDDDEPIAGVDSEIRCSGGTVHVCARRHRRPVALPRNCLTDKRFHYSLGHPRGTVNRVRCLDTVRRVSRTASRQNFIVCIIRRERPHITSFILARELVRAYCRFSSDVLHSNNVRFTDLPARTKDRVVSRRTNNPVVPRGTGSV